MFERLYDVSEQSQVNFIGYVTDRARYDFAIVYTDSFFGKPLVVCMQSGNSALLCLDDADNVEYLQRVFHIRNKQEAEELSIFLQSRLPSMNVKDQY